MKKILPFRSLFYLVFILFFALLPLESIAEHSFCIYSNVFCFKCAGCGVTRGFCAFMHFDFALAFKFNPVFTCSVFPISIFLMLEDTLCIVLRNFFKENTYSILENSITAFISFMMGKKIKPAK